MKRFSFVFAVLLLTSLSASAAELTAEAKTFLDDKCVATAKEKPDAPCNGVANATWFTVLMNPKLKEEASKKDVGEAIKAYCQKACEKARAK